MAALSLVSQYDEIVACMNVLSAGSESAFSEYLSHHIGLVSHQVDDLKSENKRLKGEKEAKDIQLKLSRKSLEDQMNECGLLKDRLKEYDKQFTILKALLSSDDKLTNLNDAERRSLALLKKNVVSPGGFLNESGECPTMSDISINVTDATDLDDDDNSGGRATWKRRRTASVEWALDSSFSKKRRSIENILEDKNSLKLASHDIHMTSPLDKQFKRPPPNKNRRKPSKGHLELMKGSPLYSPPPPVVVPPLELPVYEDDSPLPSAPSEHEVALVNQGILSPHSPSSPNDFSPQYHPIPHHQYTPPHYHYQQQQQRSPYYNEANPLAVTPPLASVVTRLYPCLEEEEEGERPPMMMGEEEGEAAVLKSRTTSDINLTRKHVFVVTKTFLKSENCPVCKKKVKYGNNGLKCKDCRVVCHSECQVNVPLPCVPNVHTPKRKQKESDLSVFCPRSIPRVPALVIHCIKEIETRGMNQEGLYRKSGSERAIKELKERLLTARGTPNLEKVEDVNVICGCLKQFFIHLKEPLITRKLRPAFMRALESKDMILAAILEAIAQLPSCNKDTLAFLVLHLQKISSHSETNKMPIPCLARVFAPTVIGSSSSDSDAIFKDIQKQQQLMEHLLNISSDYWRQYLSPDDNPEPQSPTPSQGGLPTSPCSPPVLLLSPSTPELMPIPQSPFLGPCQSPAGGGYRNMRTPVVTRSMSNQSMGPPSSITRSIKKTGGTFFGAIN